MGRKALPEIMIPLLVTSILAISFNSMQIPKVEGQLATDAHTLALWHFDEGEGQMVYDASPHHNDGTLGPTSSIEARDPSWTSGFTGQPGDYALDFSDWCDYVKIPDIPDDSLDLLSGDQFTIEFWTYIRHISRPDRGNGNHWNIWISKRTYGHDPGYVITQALRFGDSRFSAFFYDGSSFYTVSCEPTPTHQWIHVMFTYDGQYLRLYFNDVLQAIKEVGHQYTVGNDRPLSIGKALGSDEPWSDAIDGIIDEVRISSISRRPILANADTEPDTLNLKSKGEWVTAYIELPKDYSVSNINASSILLNNTVQVDPDSPVEVGDYDKDTVPDLKLKFDRAEVKEFIKDSFNDNGWRFGSVTLTVTGKLSDGTPFEGNDTIKVIVGDANLDNTVDILDLAMVGVTYWSFEGEPEYDWYTDINEDRIIDMKDVAIVCINYGKT